jgi:hypothetical protein
MRDGEGDTREKDTTADGSSRVTAVTRRRRTRMDERGCWGEGGGGWGEGWANGRVSCVACELSGGWVRG